MLSSNNKNTIKLSPNNYKIYVLSDIHSNLPALNAVLAELPSDAIIICLGDLVNYYIEPNEVCDHIRALNAWCIAGNHDLYATEELSFNQEKEDFYRVGWTKDNLNKTNLEWLKTLPRSLNLEITGINSNINRIVVCHGSFDNIETYIYPDTPFDLQILEPNTLGLLGHTHHSMIKKDKNRLLVNPGSVGQPRDYDPRASYAVINLIDSSVEIKRVHYNVFAYQERLKGYNINTTMIDLLSRVK